MVSINILTNNKHVLNDEHVCDKFNKFLNITYVDGGYIDVLYKARDMIHTGSVLVSHPLMGSIKPNETPYRSIILEDKEGALDFQSLSIIESSIESCIKLMKNRPTPNWSEKVLEDFRVLDIKLLESALSSLV